MKGGTWIAEDVTDLATHEQRLGTGGYRPARCPRCGSPMHIHDYRPRLLLGHAARSTEIARFRCSERDECGAVVQVLPAFVARSLWRSWETVETALETASSPPEEAAERKPPPVPARTLQRWGARLLSSAAAVLLALAPVASTSSWVGSALETVGLSGRRAEVIAEYRTNATPLPSPGLVYAGLAAMLHRVAPGLRLM